METTWQMVIIEGDEVRVIMGGTVANHKLVEMIDAFGKISAMLPPVQLVINGNLVSGYEITAERTLITGQRIIWE